MHMIGILVSYLDADEKRMQKRQDKQKDDAHRPDLKTLKGQTEEIAEGGISSSLMQHYLQPVLELTMHSDAQARVMAFDMLSRVISQGLVHPLQVGARGGNHDPRCDGLSFPPPQCIPYLIALETDSDVNFRNHALKVHSDLHDKYASFIHNKNMEGVRMAYHYQRMLRGGELAVVGMTGNGLAAEGDQTISPPSSALLHPLYEVVRDKRALRKELVQSLARLFDLQDGAVALSGV